MIVSYGVEEREKKEREAIKKAKRDKKDIFTICLIISCMVVAVFYKNVFIFTGYVCFSLGIVLCLY